MTKQHMPLLSFAASGTIANSVTHQTRHGTHIARAKPVPTYRNTLLQQYQKWLYQDAIWYWGALTTTQKAAYRTTASRLHISIFGTYIMDYLDNWLDYLALYHLDTSPGSATPDSSPNKNHATNYGATPSSLAIDGALYFDGINDYLKCPLTSPLNDAWTALTVEAFIRTPNITPAPFTVIISKGGTVGNNSFNLALMADSRIRIWLQTVVGAYSNTTIKANTTHHIAATWDGSTLIVYLDGIPGTPVAHAPTLTPGTEPIRIGVWSAGLTYDFIGDIDHVALFSRALSQAQLLAHSKRRYPL